MIGLESGVPEWTPDLLCEAAMNTDTDPELNPGDEAEPGTPGSGEDVCPVCHGSGKLEMEGTPQTCANCGGTGVIVEGIGGG
jgi:RecJ-like exonuclease